MSKLHGVTWAPAKRFSVVVTYTSTDPTETVHWGEAWSVSAFAANGEPLIHGEQGLLTPDELLSRYRKDNSCTVVGWEMADYPEWPAGAVRRLS